MHEVAIRLGVGLSAGLSIVVPVLVLFFGMPTLGGVLVIAGIYGGIALVIKRAFVAAYVGVLVTSLFLANVPLENPAYIAGMTRDLGPNLWLMDVPLLGLLGVFVIDSTRGLRPFRTAEKILAAFIA